jgi:N-acetyl-S-(2-succino)cysteine monooxygenase
MCNARLSFAGCPRIRTIGDLSQYPLDGPLPDVQTTNAEQGRLALITDIAKRENHTIRTLYKWIVGQRAHRVIKGTATDVADALEEWFINDACDGYNILPAMFPLGLHDFCDGVVPELQRRGLFRTAYEGPTLRDNLGLPFPTISRAHRKRLNA